MVTALQIAQEIGNDGDLKRKQKVVAFADLPGVPEGTSGKIALVNGWDRWIRYHVLFDNGVDLGSVNREDLAPAREYADLERRRSAAIESGVFDVVESDAGVDDDAAGDGDGGAGGATVNGVSIPAHLLERSKAARERLGA